MIVPPIARYFLMRRNNQITARSRRVIADNAGFDISFGIHAQSYKISLFISKQPHNVTFPCAMAHSIKKSAAGRFSSNVG